MNELRQLSYQLTDFRQQQITSSSAVADKPAHRAASRLTEKM